MTDHALHRAIFAMLHSYVSKGWRILVPLELTTSKRSLQSPYICVSKYMDMIVRATCDVVSGWVFASITSAYLTGGLHTVRYMMAR